jgi:hypothetical protein
MNIDFVQEAGDLLMIGIRLIEGFNDDWRIITVTRR